jgi:DNA-binding MarR family transcriptional regulator
MNPTEDLPTLCNCARIRRASRTITRFYDNCLAPSGLGVNQFTLLGYLNSRGPMPMNRLAELLAMDRATIGHNVRPLERDGLLELIQGKDDRRVRLAAITTKGRERLDAARPLWTGAQRAFVGAVGVEEAATIRRLMDAVADRSSALAA